MILKSVKSAYLLMLLAVTTVECLPAIAPAQDIQLITDAGRKEILTDPGTEADAAPDQQSAGVRGAKNQSTEEGHRRSPRVGRLARPRFRLANAEATWLQKKRERAYVGNARGNLNVCAGSTPVLTGGPGSNPK